MHNPKEEVIPLRIFALTNDPNANEVINRSIHKARGKIFPVGPQQEKMREKHPQLYLLHRIEEILPPDSHSHLNVFFVGNEYLPVTSSVGQDSSLFFALMNDLKNAPDSGLSNIKMIDQKIQQLILETSIDDYDQLLYLGKILYNIIYTTLMEKIPSNISTKLDQYIPDLLSKSQSIDPENKDCLDLLMMEILNILVKCGITQLYTFCAGKDLEFSYQSGLATVTNLVDIPKPKNGQNIDSQKPTIVGEIDPDHQEITAVPQPMEMVSLKTLSYKIAQAILNSGKNQPELKKTDTYFKFKIWSEG